MASTLFDNFRPLVEVSILTPDGQPMHQLEANKDIFDPFSSEEDSKQVQFFLDLLDQSVRELSSK